MDGSLRLYRLLSKLRRPASYAGKLMLVAFVGTHVPLLALVVYVTLSQSESFSAAGTILAVALAATVIGMVATLLAMHALLNPVAITSRALRRYLGEHELPTLPLGYTDQAGRLMADVQLVLRQLDEALARSRRLASTDLLTGLLNRATAEKRLAEELARAAIGGNPFVLCFVDLDGFDRIEDAFGRDTANRAVVQVSAVLSHGVRRGDWCARWDGGRFLMVLYGVDSNDCSLVLERIRVALGAQPLRVEDGAPVALKVRGAALSPRAGDAVDALLARAETTLERARQSGNAFMVEVS